jgi:hypothetical protein
MTSVQPRPRHARTGLLRPSILGRVAVFAATATVGSMVVAAPPTSASSPSGQAATQGPALPGTLRFDQPRYPLPGCVNATLFGIGTGGAAPTLILADTGTGDQEAVTLAPTAAGTWTTASCVPIVAGAKHSGDGTVEAQSGDIVFAGANQAGANVAIGAFTTAGTAPMPGKFKLKVGFKVPRALANGPLGPNVAIKYKKTAAYMAQDAVIVADTEPGDLAGFLARYGGTDLGGVTIGGTPATGGGVTYHTVRLNPAVFDATGFASVVGRLVKKGTVRVSSTPAEQLLALIMTEHTAGLSIWPDMVYTPQDAPSSNEGSGASLFGNEWYNPAATDGSQALNDGQAEALLHVMKVTPTTHVAVVDGGFAGPSDFGGGFTAPDYNAPGGIYGNIPQCASDNLGNETCAANVAQGSNPNNCQGNFGCPWHGFWMAMTAAGGFDNGWGGTAGVGGQTAALELFKMAFTYTLPLAASINTAVASGARIISVSSGVPCIFGPFDLCSAGMNAVLGALCIGSLGANVVACAAWAVVGTFGAVTTAVGNAESSNAQVFAAAGNDPNQDPAAVDWIPCNLPQVVCVGGLAGAGGASTAPIRNTGLSTSARIDIWAPGTGVVVPETPGTTTPSAIGGTSPATAFMAGVASIALNLDPSLSNSQLRTLLHNSGCKTGNTVRTAGPACSPSGDPDVNSPNANNGGYIDVLEVVREAWAAAGQPSLGVCTGGFGEVTPPTGDTPTTATDLGNITAATAGTLLSQSGLDRAITDLDRAAPPDTTFLKFGFVGSIPGVKAVNVKASITVPDPVLGDLQVSFVQLESTGIGPPIVTQIPASLSQDSSSGTAFVESALVIGKEYAVEISSVGPQPPNTNCYSSLTLQALRQAPPPPTHEPWLEVGSAEVQPGSSTAIPVTAQVPLTLTGPLAFDCTVDWETNGGTAVSGVDYTPVTSGTLVIPTGQVAAALPIDVFGHPNASPLWVGVQLTGATCPIYPVVGRLYVDPAPSTPPPANVQVDDTSVWEGDGGPNADTVTITLSQPEPAAVTVDVATSDGTALAGTDYLAVNTIATIPVGSLSTTVQIPVVPNTFPQFDRSLSVQLSAPSAGVVVGTHGTGTVTIADDDPAP